MEIREASGAEPELVRHRALLEGVCAVEFPYPKERLAGRGIVICGGGAKYLPSVDVLVSLLPCCMAAIAVEYAIAAVERYLEGHKTSTRQQA